MTIELLKAGLALLLLLGLWVGVEALWRKAMPERAARKDGLAGHGCSGCADRESCQARPVDSPSVRSTAAASPLPPSP